MMEEKTWYLGPLSDLRALDVPELDVVTTPVRYQGIHQGLTGARTADFLGSRLEYELSFKYLEKEDWLWLEALYSGLIPGPYYMIDPMKKNRLSVQGCGLRVGATDAQTVFWDFEMSRERPSAINLPIESIRLIAPPSGQVYRFDPRVPTPVAPLEQITASVYGRGSAGRSVQLTLEYFGPDGRRITTGTTSASSTMTLTTAWNVYSFVHTVPSGVNAVRMAVTTSTGSADIRLCAPQIEQGGSRTSWEPGGGANRVILDKIPTSSHRFPLRDCSVSLLET